jgi:phage/plasmid-like protein (TIGR03299 family)
MSKESTEWLNNNVLIGFTEKRGHAWHYKKSGQGREPNHYQGPVPVADIHRRLFFWDPVETPTFDGLPAGVSSDLSVIGPDGMLPVRRQEGEKAIVRSDTGARLGRFKDGYKPHGYREWLVDKAQTLIDDSLDVGSAGLLKGGAVAWVSFEVPENVKMAEGVEFRPHLLATTSFDGSLSSTFKLVVTNVVCDNTRDMALRERSQQHKVRHTRNSALNVMDAREALGLIYQVAADFEAEVAELCRTKVSDRTWQQFLDAAVPVPQDKGRSRTIAENKRDELQKLWSFDQRVSPWRGTGWGVVQAMSTHAQHFGTVRNVSRPERNMQHLVEGRWSKTDSDTVSTLHKVLAAA